MSGDSERTEEALNNMDKLLKKISAESIVIKKLGRLEDIMKELPPLEAAKLNSSLAYTLNCLYKSKNKGDRSLYEVEWDRRDQPQDFRGD
jgi:hypothetical protein